MRLHDYWWNFKGRALCSCGQDLGVIVGRVLTKDGIAAAASAHDLHRHEISAAATPEQEQT